METEKYVNNVIRHYTIYMQPQYVLLKDTDVLIGKWMVEDVLNVNMVKKHKLILNNF